MADSQTQTQTRTQEWNVLVEEWNEQLLDALEQNAEAQAQFVERWAAALEESIDDEELAEGVEGYTRAYELWMEAARQMTERVADATEGEEVSIEEFRDIWLNTANQAYSEVMSTAAFAAMTGETVQNALELQQRADDVAETTLHTLGFATRGDVEEVGDRLVELERRQHAVETKLDRLIDHLEP